MVFFEVASCFPLVSVFKSTLAKSQVILLRIQRILIVTLQIPANVKDDALMESQHKKR